jgi:hypothetical protein
MLQTPLQFLPFLEISAEITKIVRVSAIVFFEKRYIKPRVYGKKREQHNKRCFKPKGAAKEGTSAECVIL